MSRPKFTAYNGTTHSKYVSNVVMTLASVTLFASGHEMCNFVYNFQMSTFQLICNACRHFMVHLCTA